MSDGANGGNTATCTATVRVNDVDTDGDGVMDCGDNAPVAECLEEVTKDSPGGCAAFVDTSDALAREIGVASSDPDGNTLTYSLDKTEFVIGTNAVTLTVRLRDTTRTSCEILLYKRLLTLFIFVVSSY